MRRTGRIGTIAAAAAAAAFALSACGGGGTSAGSASGGAASGGGYGRAPAKTSATATKPGTPVNVVEKEFSITLGSAALHPGTYTFTVHNEGTFAHNLTVRGPGVSQQSSPTVAPGGTAALTVTLTKGSYELWCSIDSHKDRGMDQTVTVG